jgi:benzoyl-CoA reductase/2-hydroxyglutaryl-CoA dehydratase subunit BcrC/BadD/HgdB
MWRPYKLDSTSRPFLVSELKRLKSSLEGFTGNEITAEGLRASIGIYNESRALMRRLNSLRSEYPGIIKASDMVHAAASAMLIPREEHNGLLGQLLSRIEERGAEVNQGIRIVIAGHPCAVPEDNILDLIEGQDMVIINDDFFSGGRSFALNIDAGGDPIESFADYYLNAVPCTTYHFPGSWVGGSSGYSPYADYVVDLVKRGQARGVVLVREMYCDPFDLEFVLVKKRLEEEDIPFLALSTEHGPGPLEPIRTRVQALKETLERG